MNGRIYDYRLGRFLRSRRRIGCARERRRRSQLVRQGHSPKQMVPPGAQDGSRSPTGGHWSLAEGQSVERFLAKRMNAKTTELKSSHVPFLSHPKEVVKVIEEAATSDRRPGS
jgi:hypothetical protein